MGKLRELINIFINPVQPDKSLDELAQEAGIKASDLELLKKSANGVEGSWEFADDVEKPKKDKSTKMVTSEDTLKQRELKEVSKEINDDFER